MIPMILIVGTIDVFYHFLQCPLHPEWSAPCNANRILAAIYWIFLLLTIIFEIISAKTLSNIKKQIENEIFSYMNSNITDDEDISNNDKKEQLESDDKDEGIIDLIEKSKHEEDKFEQWIKPKPKKTRNFFKRKTKNLK